jgi:hypothetical protein
MRMWTRRTALLATALAVFLGATAPLIAGTRITEVTVTVRCAKYATIPPGPHSPGESPRRGGGPPLSVGSVGRAEPLPRVLCKGEGLPRERSSAGTV